MAVLSVEQTNISLDTLAAFIIYGAGGLALPLVLLFVWRRHR